MTSQDDNNAELIAGDVITELCNRRGFRQCWDSCEEDAQEDIRAALTSIISGWL